MRVVNFPSSKKLVIDGDVSKVGIHILNAGYAERGGMVERALHGVAALVMAKGRDGLIYKISSCIFESARWVAFASRTITPPAGSGVCAVIPASLSERIRQQHVPVIASTATGVSGVSESINSFVGSSAGLHLVSSQSPPNNHSPLYILAARSAMRRRTHGRWWRRSTLCCPVVPRHRRNARGRR